MTLKLPTKEKHIKMSLSLAPELVAWVREIAKENEVSVSSVIASAIREQRQAELNAEMIRGLLEDAEDATLAKQ